MDFLHTFIGLIAIAYLTGGAVAAKITIDQLMEMPTTAASSSMRSILHAAGISVFGFKLAMIVGYTLMWLPIAIYETWR